MKRGFTLITACLLVLSSAALDAQNAEDFEELGILTLFEDYGYAYPVIYSPDGKNLIAAVAESAIFILDAESGRSVRIFSNEHSEDFIPVLALSPDGRKLAAADNEGNIIIRDTGNGQFLTTIPAGFEDSRVYSLSFSPNGRRLTGAGGSVKIWDAETGQEQRSAISHAGAVFSAYSPNGKYIVSGSAEDGSVKVWNAETGGELYTLSTDFFIEDIPCYTFSPDGSRFAASYNGERHTVIWDMESGRMVRSLNTKDDQIFSLAFSPDGRRIITAGESLKVWNAETGRNLWTFEVEEENIIYASFSPDGKKIAASSEEGTVRLWAWDTAPKGSPWNIVVIRNPEG
ncbi:MAG: WD40 repeat domain-containing protein [Treponema sp.]|jgi:WD40 repeat protein|nr:WD40 repeat domain-containing protein [Treponema sp.]